MVADIYKNILILLKVLIILLVQVIFQNPLLNKLNFCFIYLNILIFFKLKEKSIYQLIYAFTLGLVLDSMTNSAGTFSLCSTLFIYTRQILANILFPKTNLMKGLNVSIYNCGLANFLLITILPIMIHNAAFFILETNNILGIHQLYRALVGFLFSTLFTIISVLLFLPKKV